MYNAHGKISTDNKQSEPPYQAPRGKIWKTNGKSEWVLVDDPDCYDLEGNYRKKRAVKTNTTPKKKKRKKRKK